MSLFPGGRSQNKDPFSKKSQFYVEFLGWMECRGLRGRKYTDPVMKELRRRQHRKDGPPKLTIKVSMKDVKITQDVEDKSKRGIRKIKFPSIPAQDVTYVQQATSPRDGRLDDTVACIYLGYMPRTQRYVHVHVYRFDEAKTATVFANHMSVLVEKNLERIQEVEIDLADKGEIDGPIRTSYEGNSEHRTEDSALGSASSAGSDEESSTFGSDEIEFDLQSMKDVQQFDNVTDELKFRLQMADTPLLLPPKDYDTIRRAHGNLSQINKRRCLNLNIVGEIAVHRERNGSNESGVDILSTESDPLSGNEKVQSPQPEQTDNRESCNIDPQHPVKLAPVRDSTNYSLGPHTPAALNIHVQMPHVPNKPGLHDREGHKSGYHAGHKSPKTTAELVYPPKITSPTSSPVIYQHPRRRALNRQFSENSKLKHPIDDTAGGPIRHYRTGSNDDIYAVPFRIPSTSTRMSVPEDELPPDYIDDFQEQPFLPGMTQRYGHGHLTRTLSDGPIRNENIPVHNSRPISVEVPAHRKGSQSYVPGPRQHGGEVVPPFFERISPSRRK